MMTFIDTSAFYATICSDDPFHKPARHTWSTLLNQDNVLICTNYILVEAITLIQRRLGIQALRLFQEDILPVMHIEWITPEQHHLAVTALIITNQRHLSLVDCTSFETMRRLAIRTAFAFDPHFTEQGFDCIPQLNA